MKDRITKFLVSENITPAEFADKIGVQRSSVSHVLNERNYPSASFIQKMLTAYKNLNPRWLLLGEGEMSDSSVKKVEPSLFSNTQRADFSEKRNSSQIGENNDNISPVQLHEKQSEPVLPDAQKPIEMTQNIQQIIGKSIDNKDIENIVLFFKDKTFTAYTPSM